jgi:hypothetical protein
VYVTKAHGKPAVGFALFGGSSAATSRPALAENFFVATAVARFTEEFWRRFC